MLLVSTLPLRENLFISQLCLTSEGLTLQNHDSHVHREYVTFGQSLKLYDWHKMYDTKCM